MPISRGLDDWMSSTAARRRTKAALAWSIALTVALYFIPFGQLLAYPYGPGGATQSAAL